MPRKHHDSGFLGKAPHEVPRNTVSHWNRYLARDPPSYDSGTLLSEADAKTMMDKIEARRKWFKAIANEMASNSRVTVTAEDIAESRSDFGSGYLCSGSNSCKGSSQNLSQSLKQKQKCYG